jgi:hypothetical protein
MPLIKITDKHSNLRLKFEHPIALNPEKNYKLGVSHLMFSFDRKVYVAILFDFFIPLPGTGGSFTVKSSVTGTHTIDSLQTAFQNVFNEGLSELIEQNKKDKKFDIIQKLKKLKITPVKFVLKKMNDDEYVVVLIFLLNLSLGA